MKTKLTPFERNYNKAIARAEALVPNRDAAPIEQAIATSFELVHFYSDSARIASRKAEFVFADYCLKLAREELSALEMVIPHSSLPNSVTASLLNSSKLGITNSQQYHNTQKSVYTRTSNKTLATAWAEALL